MNDKTEGSFILNEIKNEVTQFDEKFSALTEKLYIGCFSLYGNMLSQWFRYGSVNIGFDFTGADMDDQNFIIESESGEGLPKGKPKELDFNSLTFCECTYIAPDEGDFNNIVNKTKKSLNDFTMSVNNAASQIDYEMKTINLNDSCSAKKILEEYKELPNNIAYDLFKHYYLFTLKHAAFREELESRIFSFLKYENPFDNQGKKYIKLVFKPKRIKRVVVGPSPHQEDNYIKIKNHLTINLEYNHVELVRSMIPYTTPKTITKHFLRFREISLP